MSLNTIIAYLLSEIMMVISLLICFSKINKLKLINNKKNIFLIVVYTIILIINNVYNAVYLRIVSSIIIDVVMLISIFKYKIKPTFFNVLLFCFVSMGIELILSCIILASNVDINSFNSNLLLKILFSALSSVLTIMIFYNKHVNSIIIKMKTLLNGKNNIYFIILILIIFLNIFTIFRLISLDYKAIVHLTVALLLFMIIALNEIINNKYNLELMKNRNNDLVEAYKAYSNTIEECRELKHNLKNDLFGLKADLPKQQQEQLNKIIMKYNNNYEWINSIDDIPEGLQGVIYLKKKEAEHNKVKLILNSNKNIKAKSKDYLDLCNIIGILIDNAIEASKNTKHKTFEVNIKENKYDLNIKIINKFSNIIDINKIGKKNYSTKEFKSGIGLNYIKKLKSSNLKISYNIINDLFITKIYYKQKNSK